MSRFNGNAATPSVIPMEAALAFAAAMVLKRDVPVGTAEFTAKLVAKLTPRLTLKLPLGAAAALAAGPVAGRLIISALALNAVKMGSVC